MPISTTMPHCIGELAMIESIDAEQRQLLSQFVYVGSESANRRFPSLSNILKYGKNNLLLTAKIPFYQRQGNKDGYAGYAYRHDVLAYPVMTSMRVLVMGIEKMDYNGIERTMHNAYVHYDRATHQLIDKKDIFAIDDAALLSMINAKINELNKSKDNNLDHAMALPSEYQIKAKGISFHFAAGVVAAPNEGPIEIFLDYKTLNSTFTSAFKQLVRDNSGYWDYKRLTID